MATLDSSIVNISLPTISKSFNVSSGKVAQVVISYLFFLSGTMLIFGKLTDRIGQNKIFLYGYVIFTISSLFCGISSNITILIISRAIQGIGGAMLTIMAYAIIPQYIPQEKRGWAFGLLSTAAALGLTLGPPIGGFLTGYFSWHYIFLINVPVGIVAIYIVIKFFPPDDIENLKILNIHKFDYAGAVLSFLGVLLLLYSLNNGKNAGWTSIPIISSFLSSLIIFAIFIAWEAKAADPLVNLRIFSIKSFTFANLTAITAYIFLAGSNFIMPFCLELLKHLKPQENGLVIMVYSVVYMIVTPIAGKISDRIAPRILCSIAMLSVSFASAYFAFFVSLPGIYSIIIFLVWIAVSYGMFFSPNNNLIMSSVPDNMRGLASGVFGILSRVSIVFGVCIFEAIFSQLVPNVKGSIINAVISEDYLIHAFKTIYFFGSTLCFTGFIFSIIMLKEERKIL